MGEKKKECEVVNLRFLWFRELLPSLCPIFLRSRDLLTFLPTDDWSSSVKP